MIKKDLITVSYSGAAMSYAILFCLLVGLICSGILFVFGTQQKLSQIYTASDRSLLSSYAAIQYGMHTTSADKTMLVHPSGDTSAIHKRNWGAFQIVSTVTRNKFASKNRAALVGKELLVSYPSLYVSEGRGNLLITGKTQLIGECVVPNGILERAYIGGKSYAYEQLHIGTLKSSSNLLPDLGDKWSNGTIADFIPVDHVKIAALKDSTFSFNQKTTLFQKLTPIQLTNHLHGNLVIQSFDSIYVSAEAQLQQVILIAPIIHIQKGFKGTLQAFASERITCEEDVSLDYPSIAVLLIQTDKEEAPVGTIVIDKNSSILGGILIHSKHENYRRLPQLKADSASVIAGLVYVQGEVQLKGSVIGSLFTKSFIAYDGGGVYSNHLMDATIDGTALPRNFLMPDWIPSYRKGRLRIMDWL